MTNATLTEPKPKSKLFLSKSSFSVKIWGYRFLLLLVLGLVGLQMFLSSQFWIIKRTRPEPDYFIVNVDKHVSPIKPLVRPNLSLRQLLVWVMEASTAAYTFDFLNLDNQLLQLQQYFTDPGYNSFIDSLNHNNLIGQVRQGKLVVSSVPTGMPVVSEEFSHVDGYTWVIQMPMRISFQSANETRFIDSLQTVTVDRIATTASPRGVGISQIRMSTLNVSR